MARFEMTTTLAAPIDDVWDALQRPSTLAYVARGWLSFRPLDPPELPERWPRDGGSFLVRVRAFGIVPMGTQVIAVEYPDARAPERVVRDNGRGTIARVWDHHAVLSPVSPGMTRYTDRLTIEAGWLTPLVTIWARGFYAYRHRRWHRLVANDLDPTA